jgi:hypothetical protein
MKKHKLIPIDQICIHCQVNDSFILGLRELGHIEVVKQHQDYFIHEEQLRLLESMIYLNTELHINLEGVDAIAHLLAKVEGLQQELVLAQNKLNIRTK